MSTFSIAYSDWRLLEKHGGMVRLEYTEGTSNKFYEALAEPDATDPKLMRWSIHYGRVGQSGSYQRLPKGEVQGRADAKLRKGYRHVVTRSNYGTAADAQKLQQTAVTEEKQVKVARSLAELVTAAHPGFATLDSAAILSLAAQHGLELDMHVNPEVVPGAAQVLVYRDRKGRSWALVVQTDGVIRGGVLG